MEIKKCFSDYLDFIKATKSDGTYRFDESHARTIINTLDDLGKKRIKDINREVLYSLSTLWKDRGVSGSTINKRFLLLKRCLNHAGIFQE